MKLMEARFLHYTNGFSIGGRSKIMFKLSETLSNVQDSLIPSLKLLSIEQLVYIKFEFQKPLCSLLYYNHSVGTRQASFLKHFMFNYLLLVYYIGNNGFTKIPPIKIVLIFNIHILVYKKTIKAKALVYTKSLLKAACLRKGIGA